MLRNKIVTILGRTMKRNEIIEDSSDCKNIDVKKQTNTRLTSE